MTNNDKSKELEIVEYYELDTLIDKCTPDKRHEEIDFGVVGKELI